MKLTWNIQKFLLQLKYQATLKVLWLLNIPFLVEVTGGGLRPVVGLEKLDLTRLMNKNNDYCVAGDNIEADSSDVTQHARHEKPQPYVCTVCAKWFTRKY